MPHPILSGLTDEQNKLLQIIYEPFSSGGGWPVWDYVARKLRQATGADPIETISSLPTVVAPFASPMTYRLVWTASGGPYADPTQRVGLTVAGLWQVDYANDYAALLVRLIADLADWDAKAEPRPYEVTSVDVYLSHMLRQLQGLAMNRRYDVEVIAESLGKEPPLLGAVRVAEGRETMIHPDQRLADFLHVSVVDDYMHRIVTFLKADIDDAAMFEPGVPSPLGLAEALGYFDAVWRAEFGARLIGATRLASVTKLAFPCASQDELESRLSGLSDVLKQFEIVLDASDEAESRKANEATLMRLRRKLHRAVPEEQHARIDELLRVLQRIVRIRVGDQHTGSQGEVAKAYRELGIAYPPTDPATAWENLRTRATMAIDGLRQELESASV